MRRARSWIFLLVLTACVAGVGSVASSQQNERSTTEVQRALVDKGFKLGTIDGLWGRKSISALKEFQRQQGLPQSGMLDRPTLEGLFTADEPVPTQPVPTPSMTATEKPAPGSLDTSDRQEIQPLPTQALPAAVVPRNVAEPVVAPAAAGQVRSDIESAPLPEIVKVKPSPVPTVKLPTYTPVNWNIVGMIAAATALAFLLIRRQLSARRPANNSPTKPHADRGAALRWSEAASAAAASQGTLLAPQPANISPRPVVASTDRASAASLAAHKEKVLDYIRQRPAIEPDVRGSEAVSKAAASAPLAVTRWIPANTPVAVGGFVIPGGLIYAGHDLPRQDWGHESENCLIDPRLPVGRNGDPEGRTMGYWPSYSRISPDARRSYLQWLAGPRSDPQTYIGYVFLYFYGLERRLMIDDSDDAQTVIAEVRRLLSVYGHHGSFKRYASELLSACALKSAQPPEKLHVDVEEGSYEVPLMLKAALGLRVRDSRPIEPDLLFAYVVAHPETRVRTPARRAQPMLQQLFAEAVQKHYPNGVRVSRTRIRKLKAEYKACSGSFNVEIAPFGGDLPDITGLSEPIATAQRLFDECTDQLDGYSRALGRTDGLAPTLAALAKLPAGMRRSNAEKVVGPSLRRVADLAATQTLTSLSELMTLVGIKADKPAERARLKELSSTLAAFGCGNTADPAFALKAPKADEPVVLFPLMWEAVNDPARGDGYRPAQLSVMLGLVIAVADGHLHELEREKLLERVARASGLSGDERARLKAEIAAHEAAPHRIAEWVKRIKDAPADSRERLADELAAVASADGTLHVREVSQLEKFFRQMGLPEDAVYTRLHGGAASSARADDEIPIIIPAGAQPKAMPIPTRPQPPPASRIDRSRLDSIRRETQATTGILAEIFVDADDGHAAADTSPVIEHPDEGSRFEGLDQRYGGLLSELLERHEWTAADFETLMRHAGVMPGAARQVLNDWSYEKFEDPIIEGDDPILINAALLPQGMSHKPAPTNSIQGATA